MSIIVAGDIHGSWGPLNTLISKKNPELILQCGDFGWWPKFKKRASYIDRNGFRVQAWDPQGIRPGNTIIRFCPGNHEDWDDLANRDDFQLLPNVYYMPRGSLFTLPDNRVVLFMGGALSVDKHMRTPWVDWFPQELVPYSEFYKLKEKNIEKIDIVISHTCPLEFIPILQKVNRYRSEYRDCSQDVLSAILQEYKPDLWYFGHFHVNINGRYNNTEWFCLNMTYQPYWWRYLDG